MNLFSIGEIRESISEYEINRLLKEGWVIIHINSDGQRGARFMYVLGRPKFNGCDGVVRDGQERI